MSTVELDLDRITSCEQAGWNQEASTWGTFSQQHGYASAQLRGKINNSSRILIKTSDAAAAADNQHRSASQVTGQVVISKRCHAI